LLPASPTPAALTDKILKTNGISLVLTSDQFSELISEINSLPNSLPPTLLPLSPPYLPTSHAPAALLPEQNSEQIRKS
ncbi:hypothetical protein HK096_002013, partial [Nowakowskiella sp. JEL0078]